MLLDCSLYCSLYCNQYGELAMLFLLLSVSYHTSGIGNCLVSVFFLPFPLIVKILTLLEINFLIGAIAYIRANRLKKDCIKCDYQANWDDCPGMKNIRDKLYEHGFRERKTLES